MRLLLLIGLILTVLNAESRYALLIGNSDYKHIDDLQDPSHNIGRLKKSLEDLDFKVTVEKNLNSEYLSEAIDQFSKRLSKEKNNIGFLYYSGHGCQLNYQGYLVPTDVDTKNKVKIKHHALSINEMLDTLSMANNRVNMLFLDACRNVPTGDKGGVKGLGIPTTTPKGSLVVYATEAGKTAEDNSDFIDTLIDNIKNPNQDIEVIAKIISNSVADKTREEQIPVYFSKRLPKVILFKKQKIVLPSDSLFNFAINNNFHKHNSWLAMNFYETTDKNGGEVNQPFSVLHTSDITNPTKYEYFMNKNGNINLNTSKKYHYFLAEDGRKNPSNEIKATLHYFFDEPKKTKKRVCEEYQNRYVLLKQLFKEDKTFEKATKDIYCYIPRDVTFSYVYITTGKSKNESFGHSLLSVEYFEKKLYMSNVLDSEYKKESASNIQTSEFYINFAFEYQNPKKGLFRIHGEVEIVSNYKNHLLIKFPINALDDNIEKKELLMAQIEHIQNNKDNFSISYFTPKKSSYVLANILTIPFPELRSKFNNRDLTFSSKDIIKILESKINLSKHEAIRI